MVAGGIMLGFDGKCTDGSDSPRACPKIFEGTAAPAGFGPEAQDFELETHAYFVAQNSDFAGALPSLRSNHGRIVTVASTLGLRALSDATAYCAAKFGVVGFTRALAAELGGEVGVTLLIPGGMRTAFFDGRDEQYRPGTDASLNDPGHVADAVLFALRQPAGCEVRELVICPSTEGSYP